MGALQFRLDVREVAAGVALVVGRLVAAPIVRLGIGEGPGVGLRPEARLPLAEVLLERRPIAAPVLVDVHPLLADGVADGLALSLHLAIDDDLTRHDRLLLDDGFLAPYGNAD